MRIPRAAEVDEKQTGSTASNPSQKNDFAKTLEDKRQRTKTEQASSVDSSASNTIASGGQQLTFTDLAPAGVRSDPVAASLDIDALVAEMTTEIQSRVEPGGAASLSIEFNSRTLDGLGVLIRANRGAVNIEFQAKTAQTAAILTHHLSGLQARLGSQGIKVERMGVSLSMKKAGEYGTGRQRRGG
jgi:hypothetical protein